MTATNPETLGDFLTIMGRRCEVPPRKLYLIDTALRGPDLAHLSHAKVALNGLIRTLVSMRPGYHVAGTQLEFLDNYENGIDELNAWLERLVRDAEPSTPSPLEWPYPTQAWVATTHWLDHVRDAVRVCKACIVVENHSPMALSFKTALSKLYTYLELSTSLRSTFSHFGRTAAERNLAKCVEAGTEAVEHMAAFFLAAWDEER